MRHATLCVLLKENPSKQILLGYKKRGFGQGKYNGFGGKVQNNESIEEAAIRELYEESGIKTSLEYIKKVAEFEFEFLHVPKEKLWDQVVHVFFINKWEGEPEESEEMKPVWFNIEDIPYDKMWKDDKYWLPLVLENKILEGKFKFGKDNESIEYMDLKVKKEIKN